MRILMIHADAFSYHVTDKTSAVGKGHELDPELSKGSIGDSLVLFCCSTIQIDVENCQRFDIKYIDDDGKEKTPLLLHASISGSIDRVLHAILENQAMRMKRGKKALFPLWLAPTQLRLVPVSESFHGRCEKILSELPFRIDLDDRDLTVSRKIREAEREWIPYVAVIGEKEVAEDTLSVRDRETGEQKSMKAGELSEQIANTTKGKPFRPLNPANLNQLFDLSAAEVFLTCDVP